MKISWETIMMRLCHDSIIKCKRNQTYVFFLQTRAIKKVRRMGNFKNHSYDRICIVFRMFSFLRCHDGKQYLV